jgi:hypothetical protein
MGCASDPSNIIWVRELIATAPNGSVLSVDTTCSDMFPVITVNPSVQGLTYNVYTQESGGTTIGSALGTGGALNITLTVKSNIDTVFYIGTSVTPCNSPTRTAVPITVLAVVDVSISGLDTICVGSDVILTSSPAGGKWTLSNTNAQITDSTSNSATIRGDRAGTVSVTYTVGDGICQRQSTFLLTIKEAVKSNIKIGVRRK